ncbi:MAG: glycosyltransferase family 2 protein [Candidatus Omnitrophota bacterium]|jgi:glycosyltransferase involved in cell wall biosynthesis
MVIKDICCVVPSYNEGRTIGRIVKKLKEHNFTVYAVDDGSTDETAAIAESEGAVVVKNAKNMGKGAALRAGFKRALDDGFELILIMDGDDQHDVADIAHLIKKMRETSAGIVIGNRMLDTGMMPRIRIITNRFMSYMLSLLSGQYVPDTQCGFRLVSREVLNKIKLECSKYEIESEMIIKAARAGFKIESVPIKTVYQDEISKINPFVDTLRFMRLLLKTAVAGRAGRS